MPGIHWYFNPLPATIFEFWNKMQASLYAHCEFQADNLRGHMRSNAPWTDHTGNARNGLDAKGYFDGADEYGIVLFHQVPYGITLETRNSGMYAIIEPTIQSEGPLVLSDLEGLFGRL